MDNNSEKKINFFRFSSLVPLINQQTKIKGKKILDFGCGTGNSTFAMALEGGICKGIDISEHRINAAKDFKKQNFNDCQIEFIFSLDTKELPFADKSFDIVVCNAVFEHIPPLDREAHFNEIYRVTKYSGEIIIRGTPNRYFPKDGHTSKLWFVPWLPLWLAKYYVIFRNGGIKKTDEIANQNQSISQKLEIIPNEEWYYRGIRGLALYDIKKWISDNDLGLVLLNSDNESVIERYVNSSQTWGSRSGFILLLRFIVKLFDLLSISLHNLTPYLNLIFRRKNQDEKNK